MWRNLRQSDGEDVVELEKGSEQENKKQCGEDEERKRMIEIQFHEIGEENERYCSRENVNRKFGIK